MNYSRSEKANKQITPEPQGKYPGLSSVVSGQKFKGQNSTQGQTKEKVRIYAVNSQKDSLPHLYSAPYEKFLPLVFQDKAEMTSWPDNQETMEDSIKMIMQEKQFKM